jgi:acyl transferase domain-containing protein
LVRARGEAELPDICHTANTGRSHLEHRAVVICQRHDATVKSLEALARGNPAPGAFVGKTLREAHPRVAFLFPGQGLQYAGMARELY